MNRVEIYIKAMLLLALLLFFASAKSQINLVPNPSFEVFDTCPSTGINQIYRGIPWFAAIDCSPGVNCGSSDFFHTCITYWGGGVPSNLAGYQYPRTDNGYAGADVHRNNDNNWREYHEVGLVSPLQEKKYCAFFYVNSAGYQWSNTDCIGLHFSQDTVWQTGAFEMINVTPHVQNPLGNIISDTVNWVLIKGVYAAQGGEKMMTIGCFYPYTQTNFFCFDPPNCGGNYYFFDDFGVVQLPEVTMLTNDTAINIGDSLQLNASCDGCWPGLQYRWWPALALSDTGSLTTVANPAQTTTFYFGLIDTSGAVPCMVDVMDSVTVTVNGVGIEEINKSSNRIQVFPNPAQNKITYQVFLNKNEQGEIILLDLLGKPLLGRNLAEGQNEELFDVSHFANGMYYYKVLINGVQVRAGPLVISK